jgi:hypothetical protein
MKVLPHCCRPDQLTAYEASQAATVTQARTLAHPNEGYHAIAANERRRGLDLTLGHRSEIAPSNLLPGSLSRGSRRATAATYGS